MNLVELCEPLFNYICRLNRLTRTGQSTDYEAVRAEVKDLLFRMAEAAKKSEGLAAQYKRVELSLVFFIDSMIAESGFTFAAKWNQHRLAYERNELAGDEKFFDIVDEALTQPGRDADERLAVYYTCIGLGFTGWYQAQPEYLRKKMKQIASRIGDFVDNDEKSLVTPDAYQHTDTNNLPLALGESVVPLVLLMFGLLMLVIGFNIYLFKRSSAELSRTLTIIEAHDQGRPAPAVAQP